MSENPFLDLPKEKAPKVSVVGKNPFLDLPKMTIPASASSASAKEGSRKVAQEERNGTDTAAYLSQELGKGIYGLPDAIIDLANTPLKYGARGLSALGVPIPDEVTNALENPMKPGEQLRSRVAGTVQTAIGDDDDERLPGYGGQAPDMTPSGPIEEFAGRVAREVGANVLPAAGMISKGSKLQAAGQGLAETQGGLGSVFRNQAREAAESPGKFLAAESGYAAASGTGAATAGALSDQVFDNESGIRPTAEVIGGLAGASIPAGIGAATRYLDNALNISRNSVEKAAAREVGAARHSSYDIDEATAPAMVENPTTAELLNDRELLARQRVLRREDPSVGARLNDRDQQLAESGLETVQSMKPQGVSGAEAIDATTSRLATARDTAAERIDAAAAKREQQDLAASSAKESQISSAQSAETQAVDAARSAALQRVKAAEDALRAAQKEAGLLPDADLARERMLGVSSEGADTIRQANKGARASAGELFSPEKVDPEGTFAVGTQDLKDKYESFLKINDTNELPSFTRSPAFQELLKPGQTLGYEQFQNLSSFWKKQVRGLQDANQRRIGLELLDSMEAPFARAADGVSNDVSKAFTSGIADRVSKAEKPLQEAIQGASSEWKKLRDAISNKEISAEVDISADLAKAIDTANAAKKANQTLAEYVSQKKVSGKARDILELMHGEKLDQPVNSELLSQYLNLYAQTALKPEMRARYSVNIDGDPGSILARAREVAGRNGGRGSQGGIGGSRSGEGRSGADAARTENVSPESARALRLARDVWRTKVVEPFQNKTIRQILGKDSAGAPLVADNAALARLLAPGGEQATTYRALRTAIGDEQAARLTREYILADLASRAGSEGLINIGDLNALRRKYRDVIRETPDVARDLKNVLKATASAEKVRKVSPLEEKAAVKSAAEARAAKEKSAAEGERSAKRTAAEQEKEAVKSAKGDLRQMEKEAAKYALDTNDPTAAIDRAISKGPNAARELVEYARKVGGDGVVKGIARLTLERIEKEIFTAGEERLKKAALDKILRDQRKELGYLLGSDSALKRLDDLAEAKSFLMRSEYQTAPTGSDSVQNAAQSKTFGRIAVDAARRFSGSILGASLGGAVGNVPGAVAGAAAGEAMQRWLLSRREAVDALVSEAVINPEVYKTLTQKITPINRKAIQNRFNEQVAKAGLRQLIVGGE